MKYKIETIQDGEVHSSWEDKAKTNLALKLRANIKLAKEGLDIDDFEIRITEIGEEDG